MLINTKLDVPESKCTATISLSVQFSQSSDAKTYCFSLQANDTD